MAQHRLRPARGRWVVVALACAALLAAGTTAAVGEDEQITVELAEKNGSGVTGSATVSHDGEVTATATGLNPDRDYISYVYGAGSSSDGANPCILTGERFAGPVNTVGTWTVDDDGTGRLSGDIPLSALDAGTLSIRRDDTGLNGGVGPTPLDSLVACGQVGDRADTALGQVQDQLPPIKVPSGDQ